MRALLVVLCAAALVGLVSSSSPAQSIQALEKEMTDLVDRVSPSIVSVGALSDRGPLPLARSVGCGVVFDREGLVLTTASVVGYAKEVEVATSRGDKYKGKVVGLDPATDLAVIRVEGADLRPATLSSRPALRPGSWIFVIGNAFGSLPSVSMGVVSGLTSPVKDDMGQEMLRLAVPINPGDTGAPVVNTKGEVVGIVMGRISFNPFAYPARSPDLVPSSMSLAIPVDRALRIAREIVETGGKERGFLGVRVMELSDDLGTRMGDRTLKGVVVTEVLPMSPAESIGIVSGDLITALASRKTETVSALLETVAATKPGDLVPISYVRRSKTFDDRVRVARFVSEYAREQAAGRNLQPQSASERIEAIKAEIERLRADLKRLEERR